MKKDLRIITQTKNYIEFKINGITYRAEGVGNSEWKVYSDQYTDNAFLFIAIFEIKKATAEKIYEKLLEIPDFEEDDEDNDE